MLIIVSQIPLCRNEISRAHSALTGSLVRLAECMGLHRDPTTYSTSPVEIQVRRLVWCQICFLDFRTCEGTGPRPQIRPDDYDTRFPLNIDDHELERAENGDHTIDVNTDRPYFTDMTISRIRFECYEMHRFLWFERPKLERKPAEGARVTLTSLLARIQSFQAAMEKTYLPMLSKSVPHHFLAAEVYGILSNRLYIMILQNYISSDKRSQPVRLRQVTMSAATMILEHSMTIEHEPVLTVWSWYIGALHQYQVSLLLINELYAGPRDPDMEMRIWKCLDYAFELSSEIPYVDKVRLVLEELIGKTKMYADIKRIRAPKNMPQPGPRINTPGYKARQREEQEERERIGGLQPASSNIDLPSNSPVTAPAPTQQTPQKQYPESQRNEGFGAAVPNVNWGSIALPAPLPYPQQGPSNYNYGAAPPAVPPPTSQDFQAPDVKATANQYQGNTSSGSGPTLYGGGTAGVSTGSHPMEALDEIDWVRTYRLYYVSLANKFRMISRRCSAVRRWVPGPCSSHLLHSRSFLE